MDAQLKSLEDKLGQLVKLTRQLRTENHQLRQDVATAQSANRRLEEKIGGATQRLEALLQHLPEPSPEAVVEHAHVLATGQAA